MNQLRDYGVFESPGRADPFKFLVFGVYLFGCWIRCVDLEEGSAQYDPKVCKSIKTNFLHSLTCSESLKFNEIRVLTFEACHCVNLLLCLSSQVTEIGGDRPSFTCRNYLQVRLRSMFPYRSERLQSTKCGITVVDKND